MGFISYLVTLVLIHGLLLSQFSYQANTVQAASVRFNDFYYKLKVVSHRESAPAPPAPAINIPTHFKSPPPRPVTPPPPPSGTISPPPGPRSPPPSL
ncbi:hypothetical protein ACB092_03G097900 [Castanea dentata]